MRANFALGRIALCGVGAALFAFACSSDNNNNGNDGGTPESGTPSSGGKTGTGGSSSGGKSSGGTSSGGAAGRAMGGKGGTVSAEAGTTDGGDAGVARASLCTGMDPVSCGEYIVTALDSCGDCHTPRDTLTGAPDTTKILAGNPVFADIDPTTAGVGNIPTPNLTTLGKDGWTAQDVMDAILDGKRSAAHGGGMFPIMPYTTLHNMAKVDAEAVAAYLLSLTPITNDIPDREPLPGPAGVLEGMLPVAVVDAADIPDPVIDKSDPSYADAVFGKYLAAQVGPCLDCHTSRKAGTPIPDSIVDMSKAFAGGEAFHLGPTTVTSANITPDPTTGLKNWTPGLIRTLLKTGKNDQGETICPPMPVGPNGAFANLTDAHALAIGAYITHLPPVSNSEDSGARFPLCIAAGPPADAGSKDSGTD
jgi:mono/diheme cytochrome c family protein